jgi:hypothetical protein
MMFQILRMKFFASDGIKDKSARLKSALLKIQRFTKLNIVKIVALKIRMGLR